MANAQLPPSLTPRFELHKVAGEGSSGTVFHVVRKRDGRALALKIFNDAALFTKERAVLSRLRDAGSPMLADAGETPVPFTAIAWKEGTPLGKGLGSTKGIKKEKPNASAWPVLRDVARDLATLHEAGLVHGDVKPDNVIVRERNGERTSASLIDLGLAHAHEESARGGTPRFAAPELLAGNGTAASDVYAFALLARELRVDAPWLAALLVEQPHSRPSARWICSRIERELGLEDVSRASFDRIRIEHAYLRAHAHQIDARRPIASELTGKARTLLEEAMEFLPEGQGEVARLSPNRLARFVAQVTGIVDLDRSFDESALVLRLFSLLERGSLGGVTLAELLATHTAPTASTKRHDTSLRHNEENALSRVEALLRTPDEETLLRSEEEIARMAEPFETEVFVTADALQRRGELGRAALVARAGKSRRTIILLAEMLRRLGEVDEAGALTRRLVDDDVVGDDARAILGRIAWDARDLDAADALLADAAGSRASEVRALVLTSRARYEEALEVANVAKRGEEQPAQRARLEAIAGYVHHACGRVRESLEAFERAARYARDAASPIEEANYLTGVAAAACDLGRVELALTTSRRAALLWEKLGRDELAARAWLTQASTYALLDRLLEVEEACDLVETLGKRDARARAYAAFALVDTLGARLGEGASASRERARSLLREIQPLLEDDASDRLRLAARTIRFSDTALEETTIPAFDRWSPEAPVGPRLEWWGSRIARAIAANDVHEGTRLVSEVRALVSQGGEVYARRFAFTHARAMAERIGDAETARLFATEVSELERHLVAESPSDMRPSFAMASSGDSSWSRRESSTDFHPEQIRQLETLIRSLVVGERISTIAGRILDALILWTGVERGLVLLPTPTGELVPRVARNIARADLTQDQIKLSMGLARRALETRTIVSATDAFATLGDLHASVHALELRSVLAVPLLARGEALGVVYLDDRTRRGAFGEKERAWVELVSVVASATIADARERLRLRRSLQKEAQATKLLQKTLEERELELSTVRATLHEAEKVTRFPYDAIIGRSPAMLRLFALVDRITTSDVPVLIVGESGTGKELVARAIHANGARKKKAFVSENCGALPETLLESTLFGHVKGAFTGATSSRAGLFEVAHGGTLFLDEVAEMPIALQSKLLRVLQEGEVHPVGGERTIRVDVRILAATHKNLEEMVRARTFREDLYYRLHVMELRVPPLREHREDIPELVAHFIAKYKPNTRLKRRALDRLTAHTWPGNIRQLENEIRRALVLADDDIDLTHLSDDVLGRAQREPTTLRLRIDALERDLLVQALERANGNQSQAARELGISRFGLQKMVKRLGIS